MQLQVSNLELFKFGHPRDRAQITQQTGSHRTNQIREFCNSYDYNNDQHLYTCAYGAKLQLVYSVRLDIGNLL